MNFQNIPRDDKTVKKAFVPKPGFEAIVEFDYSQIEPRLLAYFAAKLGDPYLADVYATGQDIYRVTAGAILNKKPEDVTPAERQQYGKVTFLSIVYGAGPKRISAVQGLPAAQAKEFYNNFHENLPCVRMLANPPPRFPRPDYEPGAIERVIARKGYIETIAGRRLKCGQWEEHKMLNKLIQGSAADIMKRALVRIWKRSKGWPAKAHPILTVHDSAMFDALVKEYQFLWDTVTPIMCDEPTINEIVQLKTEMSVTTTSWADKEEWEPEGD